MNWLYWLLQPEMWIVFGLLLTSMELLLSINMVIFLSLGAAALLNGLLMYAQDGSLLGSFTLMDTWQDTLVSFTILTIITSALLRLYARYHPSTDTPDVNDY